MNQVSKTDVVNITGQFTLTVNRKRYVHRNGTPFTDEEMIDVSKSTIAHKNHVRGIDQSTARYYITDSPQLLTKDDVAKLLMDSFIAGWKVDLEQARKASDPDNKHWEDVALHEIEGAEAVETYDEAIEFYREYISNWEPRTDELFMELIELFVEN